MTRQRHALFVAPIVLALLASALQAGAARPSSERSRPRDDDRVREEGRGGNDEWFRERSSYGGPTGSVNGEFPSAEVRDAVVANAQAANARAVAREADSALDRAVRQARHNFEASKEYKDALEAEQAAYNEFSMARNRALRSLNDDERYQTLMSLRSELAGRIAHARQDANVQPAVMQTSTAFGLKPAPVAPVQPEVLALATVRMNYSTDARAMENELVRADGRVRDTQERLVVASARTSELRAAFDEALRTDPDLIEARKNVELSRIARVTAAAYYAGALSAARQAIDFSYYLHRGDASFSRYGYSSCDYGYGNTNRNRSRYGY